MPKIILLSNLLIACIWATSPAAAADRGPAEPLKAFVTSVSGNANLSTWTDANGATGITAGDFICQNRAAAAGLPAPGNFMAWLSDSNDDAYCRVHWLNGKRDDNCGQSTLPGDAGPWVRTDGGPFAAPVGLALFPAQQIFLPPRLDEFGIEVPDDDLDRLVYTGTDGDGELHTEGQSCQDWTSDDAGFISLGNVYLTGSGWSRAGSAGCGGQRRLLCVERGSGPPLPALQADGLLAFVTSATGPGDLSSWPAADAGVSGVAAGDSICNNLAAAAGLGTPGAFKAWLSDSDRPARQRLLSNGPWVRPDGVPIAETRLGLVTNPRDTAISVTEHIDYLGNNAVWTGTTDQGEAAPDRCDDWRDGTSAFESGRRGGADRSGDGWSEAFPSQSCAASFMRLYCLEDVGPDVVFLDGFEP